MKSLNPSLRRVAFAAAVFAAGNFAFAQSSTSGSTQGSSNTSNGSMQNSNDQSGSNSNWSATTANSNPNSSNSNYNSSANSNDQSSMSSSDRSSSRSKDKLSWGDRRFVHKAADGGQSEVALGQLAQEKASNPDVRQFGQMLVQDHTQANSQLMQIAQQKNVKIDQDDDKDRTYKRLSKMSGNDFDREFVDHEVEDHEKDVKMFEKEANSAKDSDLRQFASTILPKLREHLATAQRLQRSIVPTSNENTGFSSDKSSANDRSSSNSSTDNSDRSNSSSSDMNNSSSSNATGSSMSGSNGATGQSAGATGSSSSTTH